AALAIGREGPAAFGRRDHAMDFGPQSGGEAMRHLLLAAWLVVLIATLSLTWRARSFSPDTERYAPDTYAGAAPMPDLLHRRIDRVDFDSVPLEHAIHAIVD